ncbi:hypothetical protein [Subtercola vilae]|nr:hypothetical protein [Subtercola vilae]
MTDVVKADDEILEDAAAGAEGDVTDPGSPAWEAVDAATAWEQLDRLTDAKRAIEALSDREAQEGFSGDDDGFDNSWDLETAADLIDCAIGVVAPYAVGEQAESEQPVEKAAPREVLEAFVKAGRSLSSSNESALRGAAAAIQNVLASLPAPVEVLKEEAPVDEVVKAKSDPQVLVYDSTGNVIGSVDPEQLTTFANSASTEVPAEDDAPVDDALPADDAVPAEPAPEVSGVSDAAAPDEAVIPGTSTIQSPVADPEDVTKALKLELSDVLKEALEPLAKQFADNAELAEVVKGLQETVAKMGKQPDDRKSPLLYGASGVSGLADRDGQIDGLADFRKAVEAAVTPVAKEAANKALAFASIKERFKL